VRHQGNARRETERLTPPTPANADRAPQPLDLERLVERHGPAWRLLAARATRSPDDCVQEALLALVRQLPPPDDPVAWMFRAVRNAAIDQRRRDSVRQRHHQAAAESRPVWHRPDPSLGLSLDEVTGALDDLDDDERTLVVGRIWGELTYEQLGDVLDCSPPTVMRRYRSLLTRLAQRLGEDERPSISSTASIERAASRKRAATAETNERPEGTEKPR